MVNTCNVPGASSHGYISRKQAEIMILLLLALLIMLLFLFWITGFLLVTDFAVPPKKSVIFRRVLVIFPHADDEAVSCAGFLHRLSRTGSDITWLLLTKGERGIPQERRYGNSK